MLLNLRKLQSHVSKHRLSLQQYKDKFLGKTISFTSQHQQA
jgi:Fe-S cluster biosynthesis and repair protein YggX